MKVLIKNTVSRLGKTLVKKGDIVLLSKVQKLKINPRYYEVLPPKTRVGKGVTPTEEMFRFIVQCHLDGKGRPQTRDEFRVEFPGCEIPNSSLNRYKAMCEVLDPTHPLSDQMVVTNQLAIIWDEMTGME